MSEDRLHTIEELARGNRERLIDLAGRSGGNGRIGRLEQNVENAIEQLKRVTEALDAVERRQERMGVKVGMLVAAVATSSAIVGGALAKMLLGV